MERKKRSKGRGWDSCYVKTIYGTFGVEMRAYGQKLVKFFGVNGALNVPINRFGRVRQGAK